MFKIELGSRVRDAVTGFEGVVTVRSDYMTGCNRYLVQPPVSQEGKYVDGVFFDEAQLEVMEVPAAKASKPVGTLLAG